MADGTGTDPRPTGPMRIGELARRAGVSTRVLRYYEQRGLLCAGRDANGYRTYDPDAVEAVARIRELLATGLNTDSIRDLLPCAQGGPGLMSCSFSCGVVEQQMARLDAEIAELQRRRAALGAYAQVMRERRAQDEALAAMALRSD
ncbi:MerR family transcriptional regulator [Streptomyces yunnanensis]|uniref:DNA-binding transcriptional regulator, MerR family n=1 Tax=Streptomyces yunnanensis TaxID=156453 RepID=A0A9X8QV56_9ACTN|nr:MerR family transcriptional regulator [Streptomyces yunnanensis]SHM36106.1 DNA-binding transcriptional regulator, MerR family [Streptomyces yunnanensis]